MHWSSSWPPSDWIHFSTEFLTRETQCLEDAKKRGDGLLEASLENYRPSTDCLCTTSDSTVHLMRRDDIPDGRKRFMYAVCKAYNPSKKFSLPHALVAEATRFFTAGMSAERRQSTFDFTEPRKLIATRSAQHVVHSSLGIRIVARRRFETYHRGRRWAFCRVRQKKRQGRDQAARSCWKSFDRGRSPLDSSTRTSKAKIIRCRTIRKKAWARPP